MLRKSHLEVFGRRIILQNFGDDKEDNCKYDWCNLKERLDEFVINQCFNNVRNKHTETSNENLEVTKSFRNTENHEKNSIIDKNTKNQVFFTYFGLVVSETVKIVIVARPAINQPPQNLSAKML